MIAPCSPVKPRLENGFTLIEMSIVLVIIGLIIGGVMVGRDLISAASVRAQISQIEKYQTAVNTFRVKYGYLPGDIPDPIASQYGFKARGQNPGRGDGDGVLLNGQGGWQFGWCQGEGEVMMFWVDLSMAGLIDGGFSKAASAAGTGLQNVTISSTPSLYDYYPPAKIGNGNFIYAWSGGLTTTDSINYFGIQPVSKIYNSYTIMSKAPGLSVLQAYNMDAKIDDGLPVTGRVMVMGMRGSGNGPVWLGATGNSYLYGGPNPGSAIPASTTSCYDNGNNANAAINYTMSKNNGTGVNCSLSIRFQ